jgi:hypothetical protein
VLEQLHRAAELKHIIAIYQLLVASAQHHDSTKQGIYRLSFDRCVWLKNHAQRLQQLSARTMAATKRTTPLLDSPLDNAGILLQILNILDLGITY